MVLVNQPLALYTDHCLSREIPIFWRGQTLDAKAAATLKNWNQAYKKAKKIAYSPVEEAFDSLVDTAIAK